MSERGCIIPIIKKTWFWWVIGGWGIGVLFNFLDVFVWQKRWDKGAIEKEAEKIRREQG